MTSNDDIELPWKVVAKGSRSSTRRSKKPVVRIAASGFEAENKSSTGTVAGKSKSEKVPLFNFFTYILGKFLAS